ncbi:uncharacterized protein LOC129737609 [Uranotaenia lowii]|uniref:uncharacterized protein LOC129737609 n=1 Tax=Uranotaenia lowii TaxID=190385 RepID=UPI00247995E6|nr:uncharacterized protein LOC129737609 [Uranotaenia lowii]
MKDATDTTTTNNRNCEKCSKTDSLANMVGCDMCDIWMHFPCAGVDSSIGDPDRSWRCDNCKEDKAPSEAASKISKDSGKSRKSRIIEESLDLLEKQRKIQIRRAAEEDEYFRKRFELLKRLEDAEDAKSIRSDVSVKTKRDDVENWLKNVVIPDNPLGHPIGQSSLLQPVQNEVHDKRSVQPKQTPKNYFLPAIIEENVPEPGPSKETSIGRKQISVEELTKVFESLLNKAGKREQHDLAQVDIHKSHPAGKKGMTRGAINLLSDGQALEELTEEEDEEPEPSPKQLAARQVMQKDLPAFSGDPQDWPIFYNTFINTTKACGFSHTENLARLQRCLSGQALEAVRSQLYLPKSVPRILEVLKKLYGRPEIIINSLLMKVRTTPAPKANDLRSIINFGLSITNLIDHMIIADQTDHLNNPALLQEIVGRLPTNLTMSWAEYQYGLPKVNLTTLKNFMEGLVNMVSDVTLPNMQMQQAKHDRREPKEKLFTHAEDDTSTNNKEDVQRKRCCLLCVDQYHHLSECPEFQALDTSKRLKIVRQRSLCRICLNSHGNWPCRSKRSCQIENCRYRHHTLLHNVSDSPTSNNEGENRALQNHHMTPTKLIFRYVPVTLYGNGNRIEIYAFLDDGSSSTLVEASVVTKLGVSGVHESLWLGWTSEISREEKASKRVNLQISGRNSNKKFKIENVRTVGNLCLPSQTLDYQYLCNVHPYMSGLPVESYQNVVPKMIIGIQHLHLLTSLKIREGGTEGPVATKTRLGWSIYGRQETNNPGNTPIHVHTHNELKNRELFDLMKTFFKTEEALCSLTLQSKDDERALSILQKTTLMTADGGYECGLLWKQDEFIMPDSYSMAVKRFKCLERRLEKDPPLKIKVCDLIDEYIKKGYAHQASTNELTDVDPNKTWYLPLGVVTNPKKPNKIRLVWDAAARVKDISFNDLLLKGPDYTNSLPAILIRFRQRQIAITADIHEMFHRIRIRAPDNQSQRFVFRKHPSENFRTYIMDVAIFGATCSPCIAQHVKNANASKFSETYPKAVEAIVEGHYIDDWLDSTDTEEEAIQLIQEVREIHEIAKFTMHHICSNSEKVLRAIGVEVDGEAVRSLKIDPQISERVLGMLWRPTEDVFSFGSFSNPALNTLITSRRKPTKREVLSVIMSIFDPLGLISHYVIHGKILLQDIWKSGAEWDDHLTDELYVRWVQWTDILADLQSIRIPRYLFYGSSTAIHSVQIHTFSDASDSAYCSAVYVRGVTQNGIQCSLVASKTKVAPLKTLSIPRLELQAAVQGTRLQENICKG